VSKPNTSILLASGRLVDPFDLQAGDFSLSATAHSLSLLNRYTGHTRIPLSVAEHSVMLSTVVPPKLARAAIIHDMSETLTNDLPNPFKKALPEYVAMEDKVQRWLFELLEEPWDNYIELKPYDRNICADEMRQYMSYEPDGLVPFGITYPEWSYTEAAFQFYDRALELGVPTDA
jgi:hypothetical protein